MPERPAAEQSVERMARTLAAAAFLNPQRTVAAWDSLGVADQDDYREQARRIINPPALNNPPTSGDAVINPADSSPRDLYAAAIREAACPGGCDATEEECRRQRIQPEAWHRGVIADVSGTPEQFADAVMAVRDRRVEELTHRLGLAHQARRGKEHQLDGIRRALCDTGAMQDDDPYSHADLEDVIRQAAAGQREAS